MKKTVWLTTPEVFIVGALTEESGTTALPHFPYFTKEQSSRPPGLEPCLSVFWVRHPVRRSLRRDAPHSPSCSLSVEVAPPPPGGCPASFSQCGALYLIVLIFFFLSGTRSQITTCSFHMFSTVRETQISHFTFFIQNLYGSFGTLSRRTPRRRFSPTRHLPASLVGADKNG